MILGYTASAGGLDILRFGKCSNASTLGILAGIVRLIVAINLCHFISDCFRSSARAFSFSGFRNAEHNPYTNQIIHTIGALSVHHQFSAVV